MTFLTEDAATPRLLEDARYHLASIKADPEAKHLVAPTEKAIAELVKRQQARQTAATAALEHHALLERSDFDLDAELRKVQLLVLAQVDKNREAPAYRACFPDGISPVVAMRGTEQARAIEQLVPTLAAQAPDVAKAHGATLEKLAQTAAAEEQAWQKSRSDEAQAFTDEIIARSQLLRQLKKNRASLGVLYPDNPRRVRSYFRDHAHRAAAAAEPTDGQSATPPGSAVN